MTRKDYTKFAEMFRVELNRARNAKPQYPNSSEQINAAYERIATLNDIISETADIFQADNARFDRNRFETAIYAPALAEAPLLGRKYGL